MKKCNMFYTGYALLGIILLVGATLVWNARMTIETQVDLAQEAAKPAEIELTLITPSDCEACVDPATLLEEIEKQDVRILSSETFVADSQEGSALIAAFGITQIPALLVNGEYDKPNVQEVFASFGGEEQDGTFVIQVRQPVYVDLTSGEPVGLVDLTYLTDSSCSDCYDPTQHKAILESNFYMTVQSERTVDARSAEGRALINQYAITQTPTVLLSSQALAYDRLGQTWKQVGSVEEDGTFVFRQNAALGSVVYKDLETGEIIRPQNTEE